MKFIHISDVYLGFTPDSGREWSEDRQKEIRQTFLDILKDCNEKEVQLLLIAGNLFAETPTTEDLQWLDEALLTLEHTRTLLLAGYSDPITPGSALEQFKFESKTVVFPAGKTTNAYLKGVNTCVTGFSYRKGEESGRILEGIEPGRAGSFNILLANGGMKGHMPFRKDVLAAKGFDYVALGGVHKPTHLLKNRMAYSGSPEPLGPADQGKHGYILGEMNETENGTETKIIWCPAAKRSYVTLTFDLKPEYSGVDFVKMAEEKMAKLGNKNIYSIVLRGFATELEHRDFSRLNRRFDVLSVQDQTLSVKEEQFLEKENASNLIGGFMKSVSENFSVNEDTREKARRYGTEALLKALNKNEKL